MGAEGPGLAKLRGNVGGSTWAGSSAGRLEPSWAEDRKDIGGPRCASPSTEGDRAGRTMPETGAGKPRCASERAEAKNSAWPRSEAKRDKSDLLRLCASSGEPGLVVLETGKKKMKSTRARPSGDAKDPKQPRLCTDIEGPIRKESGAKSAESDQAKLCIGTVKSRLKRSSTGVGEPT